MLELSECLAKDALTQPPSQLNIQEMYNQPHPRILAGAEVISLLLTSQKYPSGRRQPQWQSSIQPLLTTFGYHGLEPLGILGSYEKRILPTLKGELGNPYVGFTRLHCYGSRRY